MSHTDKTQPFEHSDHDESCRGGYPCKHVSSTRQVKMYRREHTRHDRTKLRVDLAAGREPSTEQHRHRALWEAW